MNKTCCLLGILGCWVDSFDCCKEWLSHYHQKIGHDKRFRSGRQSK